MQYTTLLSRLENTNKITSKISERTKTKQHNQTWTNAIAWLMQATKDEVQNPRFIVEDCYFAIQLLKQFVLPKTKKYMLNLHSHYLVPIKPYDLSPPYQISSPEEALPKREIQSLDRWQKTWEAQPKMQGGQRDVMPGRKRKRKATSGEYDGMSRNKKGPKILHKPIGDFSPSPNPVWLYF